MKKQPLKIELELLKRIKEESKHTTHIRSCLYDIKNNKVIDTDLITAYKLTTCGYIELFTFPVTERMIKILETVNYLIIPDRLYLKNVMIASFDKTI